MSKKKKITLILAIFSLLFSLNMIDETYAKYISLTNGVAQMNIARWDIIVNNEHVKNGQTLNTLIEPNYVDNVNVAAGVIAPGSMGYFDVTIDPGMTDVSFDYEISVKSADTSIVNDVVLSKYYIDDEANMVIVDDVTDKITNSFDINQSKDAQTVRVYVLWNDDVNTENMNNEADTTVGHNASDANLTADVLVELKFKQKI